jgi:hypothetical protein
MEEMGDRCEKVARQIRHRVAGEAIKDRIVSLHDPDARPIRKGKLGKLTEFGFVSQLAEVTENIKAGSRLLDRLLQQLARLGRELEHLLLGLARAPADRPGNSPQL